jgi:hypothetical protein
VREKVKNSGLVRGRGEKGHKLVRSCPGYARWSFYYYYYY